MNLKTDVNEMKIFWKHLQISGLIFKSFVDEGFNSTQLFDAHILWQKSACPKHTKFPLFFNANFEIFRGKMWAIFGGTRPLVLKFLHNLCGEAGGRGPHRVVKLWTGKLSLDVLGSILTLFTGQAVLLSQFFVNKVRIEPSTSMCCTTMKKRPIIRKSHSLCGKTRKTWKN